MINSTNQECKNTENSDFVELDLKIIFNFIFRNKNLIIIFSLISFLLALLYSYTIKKTWQGEFQIVLKEEKDLSPININPSISQFIGTDLGQNDLRTEVGILGSPSVLMPIFDFVNAKKKELGNNQEILFSEWKKNNLNIGLQRKTSILNIQYKDQDKELIIPALKKISSTYQEYSRKNKRRSQNAKIDYLINQIDIFNKKSAKSLKLAQEFAKEQDLIYLDKNFFGQVNNDSGGKKNPMVINQTDNILPILQIEAVRVEAANKIRKIDLQIKSIEELGDDVERLQYIGSTIGTSAESSFSKLAKNLSIIEEELVEVQSKYKENDNSVKRLVVKREVLLGVLKKRVIGLLKAQRLAAEATMNAAMRPKGVLLEYKQLVREAARDELTLVNLENELRYINLEKAKQLKPWELITQPTLLINPVAPSKSSISILGLLIGLFSGIGFSIYQEKKSGNIYDSSTIKRLLPTEFSEKIKIKEIKKDSNEILICKEYIKSKLSSNKFGLIALGDFETTYLNKFKDLMIDEEISLEDLLLIKNLDELEFCKKLQFSFLLIELGSIKTSQITSFKKYMNIVNLKLSGIIFVEKN